MTAPSKPRKTPCASCPYRKNVPSGVWHEEEYAKLPPYDAETGEQPLMPFMCHQQDGCVCSGWLGYGDPQDLLAVRLGIAFGHLDPSCADYSTAVELHASGTAAAEHGLRDIEAPDARAVKTIEKLIRSNDNL